MLLFKNLYINIGLFSNIIQNILRFLLKKLQLGKIISWIKILLPDVIFKVHFMGYAEYFRNID